jgi:hypothetical protein
MWRVLLIVWLLIPSLGHALELDYEPTVHYTRAPTPVTVGWEYSLENEALLLEGGFKLYRGLGRDCTQYFMNEVWNVAAGTWAIPTPVREVTAPEREAMDSSIPDSFGGEVCYEATSFIKRYDLATLSFVIEESYRSERVGFVRLPPPSWWGDTARVQ